MLDYTRDQIPHFRRHQPVFPDYRHQRTSVTVAFPQITSSFHSSLILAGWVLGIVQLTATAVMPLAAKP